MLYPKRINKHILLLIFTTCIWLSALEIAQPFFFSFGDSVNQFLPNYSYNWRALIEHHTLPLVNYHQYLGQTYFAQGQTGVLYIPTYFATWLSKIFFQDFYHLLDITAIAHLIISALFFFLLLKQLKIHPIISYLVTLLWITNPYLITTSKAWIFTTYLAVYLPLNFLILEKFLKYPLRKYLILLSVTKALMLFSGYVQHSYILFLFEGITIIIVFYHKSSQNLRKF